jgi:hypothetical protein
LLHHSHLFSFMVPSGNWIHRASLVCTDCSRQQFSGETRTHPDPPTATHAGETSHPRLHPPGFGSPAGFSRQANMQTQLLQYFNYMHVHAHLHTSKQANIHNHKTFDIVQYFDNRHSSMLGILRPGHNVGAVGARVMRFRILGGSWAGE